MFDLVSELTGTIVRVRDEVLAIADGLPLDEIRQRAATAAERKNNPPRTFAPSSYFSPIVRDAVWSQVLEFTQENGADTFDQAAYRRTHKMPRGLNGNMIFPAGRPPLRKLVKDKLADLHPAGAKPVTRSRS